MSIQLTRCAASIVVAERRGVRRWALAVALTAVFLVPGVVRADVIGIGDVFPNIDDPETTVTGDLIPNLPRFGNTLATSIPVIIVGGTNYNAGGTATGQMTIDIPSDTNPLFAGEGIIGGNINGLGQVRILGLNSEWQLSDRLTVGWEGQGFLDVAAGARVSTTETGDLTPDDDVDDYDLVLGAYEGSQGFAEIDGFASLAVSTNLSVGHSGQGRIDMTNGSRLITRNDAAIGTFFDLTGNDNTIGTGYVLVDGVGSRWNVGIIQSVTPVPLPGGGPNPPLPDAYEGLLTIGRQGRGTVEVRNQGWVRVETDTIIGDEAGAYGKAVVSGADSLLWSLEDMFVGNDAATGELHIDDLGAARADGSSTSGGTFVGALGLVELNGGVLITPNVISDGVIRGDGRVESPNVVNDTGDIRNAAGLANVRERLVFTGAVANTSNIESVGGEMEFQGLVTHDGPNADLVGIDAILRFHGGITSSGGARIFLEDTLIYVPAGSALASAGSMSLWAGESTLVGDLDLAGSNVLNVDLGDPFGRLEVTGDATVGGAVRVFLADDYLPAIGDAFEIIDADSLAGTFSSVIGGGSGAGFWQASYTGSSAILSYVADIVSPLTADFDGNGVVDGGDLQIWKDNYGQQPPPATQGEGDANGDGVVDGSDFMIWQQQVGSTFPAAPAAGAVPEPSGLALASAGLAMLAIRRKRGRSGAL